MATPRFVYEPGYYCDIGPHVFRTDKYELLYRKIIESGLARAEDFLTPEPASREQLELVHTRKYLDDLFTYRHTPRTAPSEMPISREIVRAFVLGAGGTILACRAAIREHTMTMNLAGGFHHAFPGWAEGFCYINDVAVGIANAKAEGLVQKVMVVDCDLHQGNGTAYIFQDDPSVFTFSIHQEDLYPLKRRSDCDVGLPDFCPGEVYLEELEKHMLPALDKHQPELVLYVAGADPCEKDQLGLLLLSIEHLRQRDDLVIGACAKRGIPVAATLAGGYAPDVSDTVQIHYGTACSLAEHCRDW
jgi:acetoin utilization deacetylase AcuC-like enzyme